jgi:hypothetical protein
VSFREPGSGEVQQDRVQLTYPHSPGELLSRGFFEAEDPASAQKSFVMLNIFVGMEEAVRSVQQGRAGTDTIASLDSLIAAVEDYNQEVADRDIELDLELLALLRTSLIDAGVPAGQSQLADDPWPVD